MPVEIKELVIRTVVGEGPAPSPDDEGLEDQAPQRGGLDGAALEEIVQECVRQVLRVLDRRQER